ncbi:DUF2561 family protein [Mycobacterium decipiens]|uniref:DUF2561 domain-containing protein n=1 Tax=Mycobacterium decipiens TaxID=1430326 RepID=A0A1X2LXA9_9MYCO|nr:DUF2561 family protein [Mycobacterium decipiens]OSC41808.1 hypothetical protein B8W66_06710 [Mycobacterium decipiens]
MVSRYSAYRRGPDSVAPDVIDRILVGACAAVWLVLIGVSVAAAVALVDLGRGFHKMAGSPHTTWVLYAVIVVSALVIAGAIPALLRARRMAEAEPTARPLGASVRGRQPIRSGHLAKRTEAELAHAQRAKGVEPAAEWSGAAVDRIWLRGTVALTGAIGVALIAVAAATYLMAVGHDGPSWVSYGLGGAVTAGMPVIEWLYVRQLRRVAGQ